MQTIKVSCSKDQANLVSEVCLKSGALGVSELLYKINETRNLENDTTDILVTFSADFPYRTVFTLLEETILGFPLKYEPVDVESFPTEEFEPVRLSSWLTMVPEGTSAPADLEVGLKLSPGLGFGTGYHPTTKMCVQALESVDLTGVDLIDAGTGSGILAIAGILLGAKKVVGFDIEEQAVSAAKRNYALNELDPDQARFLTGDLSLLSEHSFDLLVANLLPKLFYNNFDNVAVHLRHKAFILSGVNDENSTEFESWLKDIQPTYCKRTLEGWNIYTSFEF